MPTYDYVCKACDHRFEAFQSMRDDTLTTCPNCGTEALQRMIGAGAGLHFKGSGFYLTDYKKKNGAPSVSSASTNGSSVSSGSATTDSGPSTASSSSSSAASSTSSDGGDSGNTSSKSNDSSQSSSSGSSSDG